MPLPDPRIAIRRENCGRILRVPRPQHQVVNVEYWLG